MPKSFLGVGWGFPITLASEDEKDAAGNSVSGQLRLAAYEESVRQSIWIILGTARGERVMRPEFGCGIYDLVFELNSPSTIGRIISEVRESLLFNEPRIDVQDVQVESRDNGETLIISVDYEVRATNNVFNLVYPFYLERSLL